MRSEVGKGTTFELRPPLLSRRSSKASTIGPHPAVPSSFSKADSTFANRDLSQLRTKSPHNQKT